MDNFLEILNKFDPIIKVLIALILPFAGYLLKRWLERKRQEKLERKKEEVTPISETVARRKTDVSFRLLRYFWEYQTHKISESFAEKSWAVKESLVIKGKLREARDEPGLGAAVFSFDLALNVFGRKASESRITTAIGWMQAKVHRTKRESPPLQYNGKDFCPYIYRGKISNDINKYEMETRDFRHTYAYAILLTMSGRMEAIADEYVFLTVNSQLPDGNWEEGDGVTQTPLITALYAIMFLRLYSQKFHSSTTAGASISHAQKDGLDWLLKQRLGDDDGLWPTGVLSGKCDKLIGTSLVLRGMSLAGNCTEADWVRGAGESIAQLVSLVFEDSTWEGILDEQRFRIEARIAAALNRCKPNWIESSGAKEEVGEYLKEWQGRAEKLIDMMDEEQWDLSTVTFLLDSLYSYDKLKLIATDILMQESNGRAEK